MAPAASHWDLYTHALGWRVRNAAPKLRDKGGPERDGGDGMVPWGACDACSACVCVAGLGLWIVGVGSDLCLIDYLVARPVGWLPEA